MTMPNKIFQNVQKELFFLLTGQELENLIELESVQIGHEYSRIVPGGYGFILKTSIRTGVTIDIYCSENLDRVEILKNRIVGMVASWLEESSKI